MGSDGRARAWTALSLAVCWLVIAADRVGAGRPGDLWWACYVAIALMALSAAVGWRRAFAAGLLFHLFVGAPGYTLQCIVTGDVQTAAVLAHLVPVMVGVVAQRAGPWPSGALPIAVALYGASWLGAWVWTPARHNVNLVHYAWHPLRSHFDPTLALKVATAVLVLVLLTAGDAGMRALLGQGDRTG